MNRALFLGIETAEAAGRLLMNLWPTANPAVELNRVKKTDGSLVTRADFGSDRLIIDRLRKGDRESMIVTEESGRIAGESDRSMWIVDPLDGTQYFATGERTFGVLIAQVEDKVATVGVIHLPAFGLAPITIAADQSGEVYCSGARPALWPKRILSPGRIYTRGVAIPEKYRAETELGSVFALYHLILGQNDGVIIRFHTRAPQEHDVAPAVAIITALGGIVTNEKNEPFTFHGFSACQHEYLVASCGDQRFHQRLLRFVSPRLRLVR